MSEQTAKLQAKKFLDISDNIYPQIKQEFEKIESGDFHDKGDVYLIRFTDKVNKTLRVLKSLDISEFSLIITDENVIKEINKDVNKIYEDLVYIQKSLIGLSYRHNLSTPIKKYIKDISRDPSDYKKWAKHPEELAYKFTTMITHPDNVDTYKNQIKRMILGTMSQKEFNKIFQASKYKMIPAPNKFQSFSEYKDEQ